MKEILVARINLQFCEGSVCKILKLDRLTHVTTSILSKVVAFYLVYEKEILMDYIYDLFDCGLVKVLRYV